MEVVQEISKIQIDVARHDEKISDIEKWRDKQNGALTEIRNELKQLREDFGTRPTWAVTVIVGILSTLCGSMAVYIITRM